MLRRFQISANKSLDGVLDQLNSKRVTDAGPLDLLDDSSDDDQGIRSEGALCSCFPFARKVKRVNCISLRTQHKVESKVCWIWRADAGMNRH